MNIISKINTYFTQKFVQDKPNFKFNLGLGYGFCLIFLALINVSAYNMIFNPNLKTSIEHPLILDTNLRKYRSYPTVRIKYNDVYLFSDCHRIEIDDFCNLYPKRVNILNMNIRPDYGNESFFIYSMSYLDHQGQVQHYKASPAFEKKHKIPLVAYIILYGNLFILVFCIYLNYLYRQLTKYQSNEK